MSRLSKKVALITGGAGGIGQATARLFIDEGAHVVLVDREEASLQDAVSSLGEGKASFVVADVTKSEETQAYVEATIERWGGIDIYIANAGIEGIVSTIPDYPHEIFDQVIAVNVRGVWLGLKYVIPAMQNRGGGSIVITSSTAGIGGTAGMSAYTTSKHAVVGMMRTAALECAPMGIRVNTVNPAPIETRMMRSLEEMRVAAADNSDVTVERTKQSYASRIPLQRYGFPDEVAKTMLFLASDDSSFSTGGVYMVDGGRSAGNT